LNCEYNSCFQHSEWKVFLLYNNLNRLYKCLCAHAELWIMSKNMSVFSSHVISRCLVADFPPRWPGFEPMSDRVEFVVDKVVMGWMFSGYLFSSSYLHSTSCPIFINRSIIDAILTA
jgi:hypothetical protein